MLYSLYYTTQRLIQDFPEGGRQSRGGGGTYLLLPPATKLRQGNVFRCVRQEFCPGGHAWQGRAWQGACVAGRQEMHGGGACMAGCVHGGGMHGSGGCVAGGACMAEGHAWQRGMHGRGHVWQLEGMHGRGVCVAGEMAIVAGGTHPTGMHSCLANFFPKTVWK